MHISMLENISSNDAFFWILANKAFMVAQEYCALLPTTVAWNLQAMRQALHELLQSSHVRKPDGASCYFLPLCGGYTSSDVQEVWSKLGNLESFKGTLLHKQAELFMQELAKWQREQHRNHMPLSQLLPAVLPQARKSAGAPFAMLRTAPQIDAAFWNCTSTQAYLRSYLKDEHGADYMKFEAWLHAHPSYSPFRSEWSIYDEDFQIAGQLDSLWFDEKKDQVVIMADWKRTRQLLSGDEAFQRERAFSVKGVEHCMFALIILVLPDIFMIARSTTIKCNKICMRASCAANTTLACPGYFWFNATLT